MRPKNKAPKRNFHWHVRKYSRLARLYVRRVRMVEKEMGGRIEAC